MRNLTFETVCRQINKKLRTLLAINCVDGVVLAHGYNQPNSAWQAHGTREEDKVHP